MDQDQNNSEIGEFVAQSKQNAIALKELRDEFSSGIADLRRGLEKMSERIVSATAPNFSNMAAWSAVMLTIIGMVSAPIGFFVWNAITGLDTKLQKEYQLSIQTTTQGIENLNAISKDRHDDAIRDAEAVGRRVDHLQDWMDTQTRADLDELRQRRMKN